MGEEQGFFQPTDMEVDRSSKLSLLEHISYRLRLPDRLDHSDNGHLDGGQMLELTKAGDILHKTKPKWAPQEEIKLGFPIVSQGTGGRRVMGRQSRSSRVNAGWARC